MIAAWVPRRSSDSNLPSSVLNILISVPLSEAVAILVPCIFICMQDNLKGKPIENNIICIKKYLAPTFLKVNISYFVSWATMVICWSSGLAKSTIWTLPTPEAEILLLTMADTDCSVVMGNASKALSDVGDNEHNPKMKKKVMLLKI